MKIVISTHQGRQYEEDVEYIVIHSQDGEFAILKDHIPVISVINEGYVKMVDKDVSVFVVIFKGMVEFHDNFANVLAQEAYAGKNLEDAKSIMTSLRNERRDVNKQETTDFTKMEKELRDNMKKASAGSL